MASINTIVKRKQYLWLGIVVVGTASAIGGALYLSDVDMSGTADACLTARPGRRTTARKHPRILPAAGQRCCSTADGVLSREWCHATTTGDVPVCAGA